MRTKRNEAEVFGDLAALARSPGYIHAVAQICVRDNLISYSGEMKSSDMGTLFSRERLVRTEITTILGLLAQGEIDFTEPTDRVKTEYVGRTDSLMEELHGAMGSPMWESIMDGGAPDSDVWSGMAMREPIFYGGESAYSFQYRDLAIEKYGADNPWLLQNKGFSIEEARAIAFAMSGLLDEKVTHMFQAMKDSGVSPVSWLPAFQQSLSEIAGRAGVGEGTVNAFIREFTLIGGNAQFDTVGAFNALSATPLFDSGEDRVLLFQTYSIYEALYESPFYWMMADKEYQAIASQHRGAFTETFSAQRLAKVFVGRRVHPNVVLERGKGNRVGEVDVLVEFGDRLIIVQAKSKKLTLEARRGNDGQLRKDFAGAIQESYDQAWTCAEAILAGDCRLLDANGDEMALVLQPKEILIFNVVSEHYPALAFQARQYLTYQSCAKIRAPFVMDVFFLDALTEMLETPLRLLGYARLRVECIEHFATSHELTVLSFHLKRNLWLDPEFNMVMLEDDISIDLDLAMTVRRDGVPGPATPEGILTRFSGTLFERLIAQIEQNPEPATLELGFLLLELGEDTCRNIDYGLTLITGRTRADGRVHDFTIGDSQGGIAFHCNVAPSDEAMRRLAAYCELRKYAEQAPRWFGVSLDANGGLQFGVSLDFEWTQSPEMDRATAGMRRPVPAKNLAALVDGGKRVRAGRNEPCPCGSGRKYKRCCL